MNYTELQAAALGDSHRENYTAHIARFVEQAESYIRSRLNSYGLEYTFTDADRVAPLSPVYTLPARVSFVRYLYRSDGLPLDQTDENIVAQYKGASNIAVFAVRPKTLIVAGTPGATTTMVLDYMGMPGSLAVTPTNQLLTDYPELYVEATQIYIYKRAENYESAQIMVQSVNSLINEINQKVKKQLGGARPANAYNVSTRSSY